MSGGVRLHPGERLVSLSGVLAALDGGSTVTLHFRDPLLHNAEQTAAFQRGTAPGTYRSVAWRYPPSRFEHAVVASPGRNVGGHALACFLRERVVAAGVMSLAAYDESDGEE